MADSSFDVVSKIDRQEVANALNQASKELSQRYDFRGTNTTVEFSGEDKVVLTSDAEERVKAGLEVFQEKLIKRGLSLKAFDAGDPVASGKTYKITGTLVEGITSENAKKISKLIRDEGPKSVKAQIQGEELRVSSKSRDDLQSVQSLLKNADLDIALQFVNYR
ncbi:YajQ family cyclic di-GMP-binding protein [Tsukamurella sp. M9C]|uniref:YajQ family cyclic di-GMP-binding protein n=1 Tax=unclassified Tsukamurella TaxID=2633480 RepID=UPI001CCC85C8|nr:YajQ family cyclic di-GMP-binding protein [Tsukamurella sp. M9C]MCA0157053.1 YajQ family cyclic di-GMP-binding protein [Tsukamurella sp. M9C]